MSGNPSPYFLSIACRRAQMVDQVMSMCGVNACGVTSLTEAVAQVSRQRRVSTTTLRRWIARVDGKPREVWEANLLPAWKSRAPQRVDANVQAFFDAAFAHPDKPTLKACYDMTVREAEARGWGAMPSLKTLQRRNQQRDRSPGSGAGQGAKRVFRPTEEFWDQNPAVAAFVTRLLDAVPKMEIRRRVLLRFGRDCTPSIRALADFASRWKMLHQSKIESRR